jgi:hypothetical protein
MREWRYSSINLGPCTTWRVSGQLYVPAALPPGKDPALHLLDKTGCAPEPVWKLWRRGEYLTSAGNRTLAVQPVSRRYAD